MQTLFRIVENLSGTKIGYEVGSNAHLRSWLFENQNKDVIDYITTHNL